MVEDAEEISTAARALSWRDVTSGVPDDSGEEDERQEERRLRDLRRRVKAARALIAQTPGLADVLRRDWQRAARFYLRFAVNETQLRCGVPSGQFGPAQG